jgi:hypothetical protein
MASPDDVIEKILGRKLPPGDEGSVPFLNRFPTHLLADARKIFTESKSSILTFHFITFYTGAGQTSEVKSFIEDVIVGSQDPAAWQRWDRLYLPSVAFPEMIGSTVAEIVAPLQDVPGEHWVRQIPSRSNWRLSACGQPCVLHRSTDAEWKPSKKVFQLLAYSYTLVEHVDDVGIATRRWMASRVAWQLAQQGVTLPAGATVSDVMTAMAADVPCSADAEIAIGGLLREQRELGPSPDAVPGFRGPDEWYTA